MSDAAQAPPPPADAGNALGLLSDHWRALDEAARDRVPRGYVEMIEELRALQDDVAAAVPGSGAVVEVTELLARARGLLAPGLAAEPAQVFGRLLSLPARGQTLSPPIWIEAVVDDVVTASTEFGRFHAGDNGAVHGGAIAIMFDDALGRAADMTGRGRSRTAFLKVDFRSTTPFERRLDLQVRVTERAGRKKHLAATLHDGDRLTAEASALFLALRPEQQ